MSDYNARDDFGKSYHAALRAMRLKGIRNGTIKPSVLDCEEQEARAAWLDEQISKGLQAGLRARQAEPTD